MKEYCKFESALDIFTFVQMVKKLQFQMLTLITVI